MPKWDNQGNRAVSADRQGKVWSFSWRLAWIGVPLLAGLILVAIAPSNISSPQTLLALLMLPVPAILSFVRGLDRYEPKGLSAAIWSLTWSWRRAWTLNSGRTTGQQTRRAEYEPTSFRGQKEHNGS